MNIMGEQINHQLEPINNTLQKLTINVPAKYVNAAYHEVLRSQQDNIHVHGFPQGNAPLAYIELNFRSGLIEHTKALLFKFFVIQVLFNIIKDKKLLIAGQPRLHDIHLEPNTDAKFCFELSLLQPLELLKWKFLPFKAPMRKNYKDIDRQVESFIKEELELKKNINEAVEIGDWVNFDLHILNDQQIPIFDEYNESFWLKIGNEEADVPLQEIFLNRKVGEKFQSNSMHLQEFLSQHIKTKFTFQIIVQAIVKNSFFCLDHFKNHFRLKTDKDVHRKLIEVFSFRNDVSLRRSMAEEALKLLINKHYVIAPQHLVLRQQKIVMEALCQNPDYQVYKTQANFCDHVKKLAEKQAKEMIMIDHLAIHEDIVINKDDIVCYLNLLKRPRTKEFAYFTLPQSKVDGQEMPLNESFLHHCCRREKTLNHIIYHLTKK